MRIIECEQGSPEWFQARCGLPTASAFDRIITSTGKASASATAYAAELLAEWYTGEPTATVTTEWMARGAGLEKRAVSWYELASGLDTKRCGLCVTDDGRYGASPDRLVGDDGVLEIKCYGDTKHILNIIGGDTSRDHYAQVQGQLLVTGRAWAHLAFYHPLLPSKMFRFERDDPYIEKLSGLLDAFCTRLADGKAMLRPSEQPVDDSGPF